MENKITIKTVTKPKIGNCAIQPLSGLAGETLFTISCINLRDENNMENVYEYYQKNKNDKSTMGNILIKYTLSVAWYREHSKH